MGPSGSCRHMGLGSGRGPGETTGPPRKRVTEGSHGVPSAPSLPASVTSWPPPAQGRRWLPESPSASWSLLAAPSRRQPGSIPRQHDPSNTLCSGDDAHCPAPTVHLGAQEVPSTGSAQVPVCPPSGRSTSMYTVGSSTRNRAHCSPPLVEDLRVHKPGSQCGGQVQAQSQEPAWAGTASGCPSTSHSPESEEPRVASPGSCIVRGCTYKPIKARPHTKMELGGSSANQPVQPQCLQQ